MRLIQLETSQALLEAHRLSSYLLHEKGELGAVFSNIYVPASFINHCVPFSGSAKIQKLVPQFKEVIFL